MFTFLQPSPRVEAVHGHMTAVQYVEVDSMRGPACEWHELEQADLHLTLDNSIHYYLNHS